MRGTRAEPGGDVLQRVTCGNLCPVPPVGVPSHACLLSETRRRPLTPETLQSGYVHRVEWFRLLEPLNGRRVDLTGCLERVFSIERHSIALKTQRACMSRPALRSALSALHHGACPFQLAAWERNPFVGTDLRGVLPHGGQCKGQV